MTSLLFRFLALLPLSWLHVLGHGLYVFAYHVLRWRVKLARENLAGAFPDLAPAARERILRDSYRNLAGTVLEAIWGFRASGEELMRRVHFENPESFERYKAERMSVVVLTAHTCNWEWLLLAAGARFGVPIDAVYKPLRLRGVDKYTREARSRFGGNPIPFTSFLFELMRRAHEPRAYAMVADQTPHAKMPKFWTTFLNRDTAFFLGPERIARYLDAPVFYAEMKRVRLGHYSVRLHVLADPPYDDDEKATGPIIAERYARALEATIRAHPADWMWIHNKWKYGRPAGDPGSDRRRRKPRPQEGEAAPARR